MFDFTFDKVVLFIAVVVLFIAVAKVLLAFWDVVESFFIRKEVKSMLEKRRQLRIVNRKCTGDYNFYHCYCRKCEIALYCKLRKEV